jgi:DNA-binding response OmpR family regulator
MFTDRILLVEDEGDLLDMFSEQLTLSGYSVDKFADPIQACSYFEKIL